MFHFSNRQVLLKPVKSCPYSINQTWH
uniref:Uncharacterized protein n=1 Tax=Arundo donax TaxID=35708 RepID=A0A0A9B7W1_ARUDO